MEKYDWNDLLDYKTLIEKGPEIRSACLKENNPYKIKIAVLAGSTVGVIKEFIETFLSLNNIQCEFWEGEYNRIYEDSMFDNTELTEFHPDFIYLHMTNKNLPFDCEADLNAEESAEKEFERLCTIWGSLYLKHGCKIIQNTFEYYPYRIIGNASRYAKDGLVAVIDSLNSKVTAFAREHSYMLLNDLNYISANEGLKKWYNSNLWFLYKYPFDMSVMPSVAMNIAAIIKSASGKNRKMVITDLDNTLWKGEIGELGPGGIEVGQDTPNGEQFQHIQIYLRNLKRHGVLLNICSKNDYETGLSGLETFGSVLKPDDFTEKRINWEDKYYNIQDILKCLNLASDSAVFIDDNKMELESVKAVFPDMFVVRMKNADSFIQNMENYHFFECTENSEEDQKRSEYYKTNQMRDKAELTYANHEEFLKSLRMKCIVSSINKDNINRVVQLANKTNQFNMTTKRMSLADMEAIINDPSYVTITGRLQDRYGDNGLVSVIIAKITGDSAEIILWIMSCRVFRRNMEYAMWSELLKELKAKGIKRIFGYYIETAKNGKVKNFYGQLGFNQVSESNLTHKWEYIVNKKNVVIPDFLIDIVA